MVSKKTLDGPPPVMVANYRINTLKRARRLLRGCALILAEVSAGNELLERVEGDAAVLAHLLEVEIFSEST